LLHTDGSGLIDKRVFADIAVKREHMSIVRELGNGNFSRVMEVTVSHLPQEPQSVDVHVAAKFSLQDAQQQDIVMLFNEAQQMRQFTHANVVSLVGVCFDASPVCILLELMSNGDARTYLRAYKTAMTLSTATSATASKTNVVEIRGRELSVLASGCSAGFEYLASRKYIHRDLAARNVVLTSSFVPKLGDFGMQCLALLCLPALLHANANHRLRQCCHCSLPLLLCGLQACHALCATQR
jgi:serine/threonine protein kinase